jgi:hypothetical protein
MGYIIVPTAARLATWRWPIKMTTEVARTELVLHNDPRIMAAVGAVVSFCSGRCGLTAEAQDALTSAAVEACKETFPLAPPDETGDPTIKMVVSDYPDRVEVEIQHKGEPKPSAGLDSFAGNLQAVGGGALSAALQKTSVDRVQYDTKDGVTRMTLIKYCAKGAKV